MGGDGSQVTPSWPTLPTQRTIADADDTMPTLEELNTMSLDRLCDMACSDKNHAADLLLRIEENFRPSTSVPVHRDPVEMVQRIRDLAIERISFDETIFETCPQCITIRQECGHVAALAALALRMLEKKAPAPAQAQPAQNSGSSTQPRPQPARVQPAQNSSGSAQPPPQPAKNNDMVYKQSSKVESGKPSLEERYLARHGFPMAMIVVCAASILGSCTRFDWIHLTLAIVSFIGFIVASLCNGCLCCGYLDGDCHTVPDRP